MRTLTAAGVPDGQFGCIVRYRNSRRSSVGDGAYRSRERHPASTHAGGRFVNRIAFGVLAAGFGSPWPSRPSLRSGRAIISLVYVVGGWLPPLGIALRADGISAAMMLTTAIVICATALFAQQDFAQPRDVPEARGPFVFWPLIFGSGAG